MRIGADIGGTFTDIAVNRDDGSNLILYKLPSTPLAPEKAIVDGLNTILADNQLKAEDVRRLSHGTTVGTNALIQRKCGTVALVTSQGFRDLLEIGRQTRPTVYDMHRDHPAPESCSLSARRRTKLARRSDLPAAARATPVACRSTVAATPCSGRRATA